MSSKTFDKFLDQQIKILKSKASETEDVMGLLVGEPQTSQGGKKIKGTLAYAGVSLNNRLYLPEELKKGDGMTVPLILNHASTAGAEEELDRLPQEFRTGLEQGKEMRVGEVSLQWDAENLTLYYTGEVVDQFFQREVDDAHMAVSLGMYYDSDSPQVCDESCYTVIKGAEFHEVSLVYHPGFPIATIEAYEALQRKTRLGESLVKVKFNEGITDNLTFRNYNDPLRCKICGTQFFSEDHLAKHMKKTGHKEEEKPEREITNDLPPKEQPDRSYFSQRGMSESLFAKATEDSLIKIEDDEDDDTQVTVLDEWKNETHPDKNGKTEGIRTTKAIEINVMTNYEEDEMRKGYFICKRCGGTIRDIPKEETGQGKGMLELHLIGHDRDDKNKNARDGHRERYDNMKKWWEKPIASEIYQQGGQDKNDYDFGADERKYYERHSGKKFSELTEEDLDLIDEKAGSGEIPTFEESSFVDEAYGEESKSNEDVTFGDMEEFNQIARIGFGTEYSSTGNGSKLLRDAFNSLGSQYNAKWRINGGVGHGIFSESCSFWVDRKYASNLVLELKALDGSAWAKDGVVDRWTPKVTGARIIGYVNDYGENKTKAVEMPELVISRRQGENILAILQEELEELRAEEPKDYNAIGRVRLLIMKTRKEIYPDQDPYLTIDLDYKKLEDQESLWNTKKEKEDVQRYSQWGWRDPHDQTIHNPDGSSSSDPVYNRTGAMRDSKYQHDHIEDSQTDNWSRGGYGDRREGQIIHAWQMFRNQLKPFNPDDMERTFSLWINFAQNQGISYEKANQLWKDQDIESMKGSSLGVKSSMGWESSWKHCKKCNQMRKFSQSYDHSTGTRVIDHKPDERGGLYRINDGDPQPRYLQYCETCDMPDEDEVTRTSPILITEVIYCNYCNKTFPENNWQKKEQHELDDHGGKQSKLFEGVDDIISQVKKAQKKRKREKSTGDQLIDELTGGGSFFKEDPRHMPDWMKNIDMSKAKKITFGKKKSKKKR